MPTYHVWTVGCQMNKSDSERLESGLAHLGLTPVEEPELADVVVLNTCVVRQAAEDTATGMLGRLRPIKAAHPDRVVAVMGCMVGPKHEDLSRRFPQVDVWARPQQFDVVLRKVGDRVRATEADVDGCLASLVPAAPAVASFVPIVHGCDKFCSFCIIPYRRGRETSRPIEDVVREVRLLAGRGVREVTLLGQNVDSYGHDLRPRLDLADLLSAVQGESGIDRVRFLTSHPNDMSSRIIRAVRDLPKVCENVNLPFQAGDDKVLADMRRGYTSGQYLDKVAEVRETIPGVTLTTDLIVGFPGETEAQFENSLAILEQVRFDKVHAAMYSERAGTLASRKAPDEVPAAEKKRRLAAVSLLQERIQADLNAKYVGTEVEVLADGRTRGRVQGRTRGDKLVYVNPVRFGQDSRRDPPDAAGSEGSQPEVGAMLNVGITAASPWSLEGSPVTAPAMALAGAARPVR
jgi:tRNA-2-methylthio-N6-dimethylallyladenosine synthase